MSECNRNERTNKPVNIRQIVEREIEAVRKAWKLTPPEPYYRDPRWLKSLASQAARAGKLPKRSSYDLVTQQLHDAGYHKAMDHMGIICVDGERHVILEPYESSCSMDTARRIASELATRLGCRAWASLRSWHYPGSTIRITLTPLHTKESDTNEDDGARGTPSQTENVSVDHRLAIKKGGLA